MSARVLETLVFYIILAVLIANTAALGGVLQGAPFATRLMILIGFAIQIPLLMVQKNYFRHISGAAPALFALMTTFILLGFLQYRLGFRQSPWTPESVNRFATYEYLLQSVFYVIFFWLCLKTLYHRHAVRQAMLALSLVTFTVTAIGLLQRLSGTTKIYWLYETGHKTFFGPFFYENNFGAFLCLTLPLTGALAAYRASSSWDRFPEKSLKNLVEAGANFVNSGAVFFIFLVGFCLAGAFFSGARAAALSLLFFATIFLIAGLWIKRKSKLAPVLAAFAVLGVISIAFAYPGRWTELYNPAQLGQDLTFRLKLFAGSAHIFLDHIPFGVGLGCYKFAAPQYLNATLESISFDHANNDYIELAAETGVTGLLIVLSFFAIYISAAFRELGRFRSRFCILVWAQGVLALGAFSLTILSDAHLKLPLIPLFLFMQLALVIQSGRMDELHASGRQTTVDSMDRRARVASIALIAAVCAVFAPLAFRDYKAELLLQQGNSLTHLKKAALLEPDNPEVYTRIAKLHYALAETSRHTAARDQHLVSAISASRKSVELAPTYAPYWFSLGQFEYIHGERGGGLEALETAVKRSPVNRQYAAYLLSAYLKEYERVVSPTRKAEFWQKSVDLYVALYAREDAPNESELRMWMPQYNEPLIRQLRSAVSMP